MRSGAATLVAAALPLGASILLLGAASPSPNPFPFLVESSSQQQRWLPRPASCRRLRRSSMVQQQQQPSSVSAVRAVPIRGRRLPSTRPSVRRGRFPRPPARLPVPEPSSPGCRSSSAWPPSARISTVAACRGFFRRRPLWLLARRRRSARPRPSTAAAAAASRRPPRAVCAPSAAAVAALLHLHFRGSTSASSPLADPPVAAAPLLRNVRPPACELRPAVNPSIRLLPPVCSSRWSSWLVLQHRSWRLCTGGGATVALDLLQP